MDDRIDKMFAELGKRKTAITETIHHLFNVKQQEIETQKKKLLTDVSDVKQVLYHFVSFCIHFGFMCGLCVFVRVCV